jgi:hypothetical protein
MLAFAIVIEMPTQKTELRWKVEIIWEFVLLFILASRLPLGAPLPIAFIVAWMPLSGQYFQTVT